MSTPAPLTAIAAAITDLMGDGLARTEEQIAEDLVARGVALGDDPFDAVMDVIDDEELTPLLMSLADERLVLLPALLRGRTFTHRLSAAEVDLGFLAVAPDLSPVSLLTEDEGFRRLVDGSIVQEALVGFDDDVLAERGVTLDADDDGVWLLAPDALTRAGLAAGDTIGVTVREDGFELAPATAHEVSPEAVEVVAGATPEAAEHPGSIAAVVWSACADDPDVFRTPQPPLSELLPAAGLIWDVDLVAPAGFDFAGWRSRQRLRRLAHLHRLDEDAALAVLTITSLYDDVAALVERAAAYDDPAAVLDEPGPAGPDDPGSPALDPDLVRATLDFLADPDVAEAVLVETVGAGRDGAAALGLFAETMEPRAPRAARVALRWLRGKAHERLGDAITAERTFEQARTLDAGWEPVLLDLANYASDRGDAERGLSLLRQAGISDDDSLVQVLQHFRPVDRSDLGRNDPCWCGSGRKYKVCHRGREVLPLEDRAAWLYQKAGRYLTDGPWRHDVIDLAEVRSAYDGDRAAMLAAIQDPLVNDAVLFEGGAFAAFLEERGVLLPDDERLLAEQWLLVDRSVFEIEDVRPGAGLSVRDLRTGDRHEVRERTASRSLRAGELICARVVPAGDTMQIFGGLESVSLRERDTLIALLDEDPTPHELVELFTRRFAPPVMTNTEGDDLLFCEAVLRSPDVEGLVRALDDTYERVDDWRWHATVVTHGMERVRATFILDGDELTVETNSGPRMDRVLSALRELQPGLELVEDVRRTMDDLPSEPTRAPLASSSGPTSDDPDLLAALDQLVRQHEQAWLDESIPALAGVTPREAAADPTRRPDLIRLLDSFPPATGPGQMDPDRLRTALGL
ncbi:SEC-C metal-binding domain-containing protein [Nocardioides massiliensis]|uniref:Tetratricopeptide (TPR) repeat protein n=1 Tax=Nocardioides massiliensis TaxID=1325935 RepID=A0ABT9NMG3_9ACTN|nr:SEC-C domain-containing protein [Nocardioides massiliensis]MDP9821614.1 tetratricopeptide (TPR) repeat protein [Nocardioides massiliensis]